MDNGTCQGGGDKINGPHYVISELCHGGVFGNVITAALKVDGFCYINFYFSH
jgi:hypothetical protein